jgi:hypothetical protein
MVRMLSPVEWCTGASFDRRAIPFLGSDGSEGIASNHAGNLGSRMEKLEWLWLPSSISICHCASRLAISGAMIMDLRSQSFGS